jgi:hypothetical protein
MLNKEGTGLAHFADENGNYKGNVISTPKVKKTNTTRI